MCTSWLKTSQARPSSPRFPRRRVLRARAAPEDGGLRELADVAVQVLEQPHVDLHVAGLVPDLPGHVHGELPGRVREIVDGTAGPFHRLQLPDHDAVDALLDGVAGQQVRKGRKPLIDLELRDLARPHPDQAILAGQLVVGDGPFHVSLRRRE